MSRSIRITDAEQEVMTVVWEWAPVAASTVAEVLKEKRNWSLAQQKWSFDGSCKPVGRRRCWPV